MRKLICKIFGHNYSPVFEGGEVFIMSETVAIQSVHSWVCDRCGETIKA